MSEGYNGWRNYPTWAVNLWLSNDEDTYNVTRELIAAPVDLLGSESNLAYVEEARRPVLAAAERLKRTVRDHPGMDAGATMAGDLLGYALDQVDWLEIAAAWLQDMWTADVDALTARARELGAAEGKSAASWYFDGNTSDDTYRRVLAGLDDGDPAILDTLPASPLSGEWADGPTPRTLADDLGIAPDDARLDELCSAYEDAFAEASSDGIEAIARNMLSNADVAR